MINIKGIPKVKVLQALYERAKVQGLGRLKSVHIPLSDADAAMFLAEGTSFDYLLGRVMKVDIGKDELDPWLYDRDNGPGAAEEALRDLLAAPRNV